MESIKLGHFGYLPLECWLPAEGSVCKAQGQSQELGGAQVRANNAYSERSGAFIFGFTSSLKWWKG